jgi:hypothetical protein
MAPFGKNKNAVRKGEPLAVVAKSATGPVANAEEQVEAMAGKAMLAPTPRKKLRRVVMEFVMLTSKAK